MKLCFIQTTQWPLAMARKKYSLLLMQSRKICIKSCSKFKPEFSPFLLFSSKHPTQKETQLPVHVCKRGSMCVSVALYALAFLWHFNFMLSNSRLKGESQERV